MDAIKRVNDHSLFRAGIFPLPEVTDQAGVQIVGYYNPITDSIFATLFDEEEEHIMHETLHRIFSMTTGGFVVLKVLAGVSHTLLSFLLEVICEQKIQITGKNLDKLQVEHPAVMANFVRSIIKHLQHIEHLYDLCYWSLIPPAEIAAIDFTLEVDEKYEWFPQSIENNDENRRRQEQLIHSIGMHLAQGNTVWHNLYEDVQKEFYSIWEAYKSIPDPSIRRNLLELTMSAVLQPDPSNPGHILVMDSLDLMRKYISEAKRPNALERFKEHIEEFTSATLGLVSNIAEGALLPHYLSGFNQNERPLYIVLGIHSLMLERDKVKDLIQATHLNSRLVTRPFFSLFFYWIEPHNQRRVFVNSAYRLILEKNLISNLNPDMKNPFDEHWWRELAFFETFRQALKTNSQVVCPFLHWEGVDCTEPCPIRKAIAKLQKHTQLVIEGAVCPL